MMNDMLVPVAQIDANDLALWERPITNLQKQLDLTRLICLHENQSNNVWLDRPVSTGQAQNIGLSDKQLSTFQVLFEVRPPPVEPMTIE